MDRTTSRGSEMKSRANEKPRRGLEVVAALGAIIAGIGSIVGGWDFSLLVVLILLATTYAVFRDVRTLMRVTAPPKPAPSPEQDISPQGPSRSVPARLDHRGIHADQETERI